MSPYQISQCLDNVRKLQERFGTDMRKKVHSRETPVVIQKEGGSFRAFLLLALLLLVALPTHAAITITQAANAQGVVTAGTNLSATVTATGANCLLAAFSYTDATGATTATFTDSASETYTQAGGYAAISSQNKGAIFYKAGCSSGVTSVSVSWAGYSGSATVVIIVYEVGGIATGTPLDSDPSNPAIATNSATGTSLASASLNTANANDVLLYGVGENVTSSGWADTVNGFAIQSGGSAASRRGAMAFKIVSATQSGATTTMSWTTTGANRVGILAAFADTNQGGAVQVGVSKRQKLEQMDPQRR